MIWTVLRTEHSTTIQSCDVHGIIGYVMSQAVMIHILILIFTILEENMIGGFMVIAFSVDSLVAITIKIATSHSNSGDRGDGDGCPRLVMRIFVSNSCVYRSMIILCFNTIPFSIFLFLLVCESKLSRWRTFQVFWILWNK